MAQIDATAKWHGELTPEVRKAIEEKVYDSIKSKSPEDKQAWREVLAGSPDKVLEFIEAPLDPSQNPPVELGADFVKGCLDKFEQEEIFKDKQEEVKEKAAAAVVAGPVTDTPAKSTEGGALHDLSKVFSEAPKLAKPVMQFLIGDTTKPPTKMGGLLVKLAERYLFSKEAMQEMGLKQGLQVKTVGECFSFVATVGIAKLPTVIGLIKRVASIGQATATVEGLKGIVTAKTLGNASGVLKTFLAQGEAQQEKIKKKGTWVERDAERKQGGESPPAASIPCR